MIKNIKYINLSYQKDRKGTVLNTNTFNGFYNPVFTTYILIKKVLLIIYITMVATKRLMVVINITMVAIKRLMVVINITMVATTITMFVTKITLVATKRLMVTTKRTMVVIKTTVFANIFRFFWVNTIFFITSIILLLKKRVYALASIIASFALMANVYQIFVGHICNLKGYNQNANWFRTQW